MIHVWVFPSFVHSGSKWPFTSYNASDKQLTLLWRKQDGVCNWRVSAEQAAERWNVTNLSLSSDLILQLLFN